MAKKLSDERVALRDAEKAVQSEAEVLAKAEKDQAGLLEEINARIKDACWLKVTLGTRPYVIDIQTTMTELGIVCPSQQDS